MSYEKISLVHNNNVNPLIWEKNLCKFCFHSCMYLTAPIMAPQFSIQERNFFMMEYLKHKGSRDYEQGIIERFIEKFPNSRAPSEKKCD